MPIVRSITRVSVLACVIVVLAACGTTAPPEKEALPDSAYILESSGQLDATEFIQGAEIRATLIESFGSNDSVSLGQYGTIFSVGEDGAYDVELDARDLGGEPIEPERFVRWQLSFGLNGLNYEGDLEVSDTSVGLKVVDSISLYQKDPAGGPGLRSHNLGAYKSFPMVGYTHNVLTRMVFSEQAVSVGGSLSLPGATTPYYLVDLQLEPGWNLVYIPPGTSVPRTLVAEPYEPLSLTTRGLTMDLASRADVPQEESFQGFSLFAAHEVFAGDAEDTLYAVGVPASTSSIFTRPWIRWGIFGGELLVPFEQAMAGAHVSGTASLSEPSTNAAFADVRYVDETDVGDPNWWVNPSLATGQVELASTSGNPVMALYVDRSTNLDLDGYTLEVDGQTKIYYASGLDLKFGWNLLEAILDTNTMVTELVVLTGEATWDFVPYAD